MTRVNNRHYQSRKCAPEMSCGKQRRSLGHVAEFSEASCSDVKISCAREYQTCKEASTTNPAQKQLVRERLNLHQTIQVEERKDYWRAKQNAILYPNESMCLIIDGMDQILLWCQSYDK